MKNLDLEKKYRLAYKIFQSQQSYNPILKQQLYVAELNEVTLKAFAYRISWWADFSASQVRKIKTYGDYIDNNLIKINNSISDFEFKFTLTKI